MKTDVNVINNIDPCRRGFLDEKVDKVLKLSKKVTQRRLSGRHSLNFVTRIDVYVNENFDNHPNRQKVWNFENVI